jgi:hypothetical protein
MIIFYVKRKRWIVIDNSMYETGWISYFLLFLFAWVWELTGEVSLQLFWLDMMINKAWHHDIPFWRTPITEQRIVMTGPGLMVYSGA